MGLRRKKTSDQGIDISPLIDVVFILLIFFMVSTTFIKDAKIDIERPSARSATAASSKSIRVTLGSDGSVFLQGNPIAEWTLQSRLRESFGASSEKTVLVVTDKNVSADKLIDVVDQCRLSGASHVGVATLQETGP